MGVQTDVWPKEDMTRERQCSRNFKGWLHPKKNPNRLLARSSDVGCSADAEPSLNPHAHRSSLTEGVRPKAIRVVLEESSLKLDDDFIIGEPSFEELLVTLQLSEGDRETATAAVIKHTTEQIDRGKNLLSDNSDFPCQVSWEKNLVRAWDKSILTLNRAYLHQY